LPEEQKIAICRINKRRIFMNRTYRQLIYGAALLLGFLLAACGGSGGADSTAATTTVSGTVMAGPTSGARVKAKTLLGNYSTTSAPTDNNGAFQLTLPNSVLAGDLIFEAGGGTFPDEATATPAVTLVSMSTRIPAGTLAAGTNVTIDPASTIINELMKAGKTRAVALADFDRAFGYTPDSTVKPAFACISSAATTAQRLAGLRAAAFSQLAMNLGVAPARQHELLLALAEDLADGTLDGLKPGGAAVTTASAVAIPADIANRFGQALVGFQFSANNKSKLKPDQIGTPAFHKKALTSSYSVEYVPGTMAAATGKSMFRIKLTNRADGTPASGKTVTLRPYMYMATKSHSTPLEAVVDNGDGTYSCTVYYVMSTAMSGMPMGIWELTVTIGGTDSATFYPTVAMPMAGTTTLAKLSGVTDAIKGLAGLEKRTWFLFNDGLTGTAGSYNFNLFLATKEMGATLTFPAVKVGDSLNNETGSPWTVTSIAIEVSTDKTTWSAAIDNGAGHWTAAGLGGLTAGTAGKLYVRLTVNGEVKTTDGLPLAASGLNGYQTFTVTP